MKWSLYCCLATSNKPVYFHFHHILKYLGKLLGEPSRVSLALSFGKVQALCGATTLGSEELFGCRPTCAATCGCHGELGWCLVCCARKPHHILRRPPVCGCCFVRVIATAATATPSTKSRHTCIAEAEIRRRRQRCGDPWPGTKPYYLCR